MLADARALVDRVVGRRFPTKAILCLAGLPALVFFSHGAHAKCGDPPKPGVNWAECSKGMLLLDSRDLTASDFSSARLSSSTFIGARLSEAKFPGAEISLAKL